MNDDNDTDKVTQKKTRPTEPPASLPPLVPIGVRLRAFLLRKSIRPTELARRLGVSRQAIDEILSGATKNPGIATVEQMVAAAGGTMGELYESE